MPFAADLGRIAEMHGGGYVAAHVNNIAARIWEGMTP